MAENENGQEKTEDATAKRLEKAREEGQVARSRELTTSLVLLVGVAALMMFGANMGRAMLGMMQFNFEFGHATAFDEGAMLQHLVGTADGALGLLIPFFALVTVAALIGPTAIGGFLFSNKAVMPKLSRMDPLAGIKRMFSANSLLELFKALGKFILVAGVAVLILVVYEGELLSLGRGAVASSIIDTIVVVGWSVLGVSASLILIAAIDVPYQLFEHQRKLKMTRQELRDELKDTEGKPEVKGRLRQMQRQLAHRRMMAAVPQADVVITNPEHFSVALKYDTERAGAPIVVAKGVDHLALKIREIAAAHNVQILAAPPLARSIYFTTELDREIPATLYLAVAQVLAWVFQLKAWKPGTGRPPKPPEELVVPLEVQFDVDGRRGAQA